MLPEIISMRQSRELNVVYHLQPALHNENVISRALERFEPLKLNNRLTRAEKLEAGMNL